MSVTLTYDRNGATGGAVPVDATAYTSGASAVVQGNTGALNYAGYTFSGWNTAANGSGTGYDAGDLITLVIDTTIYAIWASATSLITPTLLREHMASSLSDIALQRIIDAEESEIVARYGAVGSQIEEFSDAMPGSLIFPSRIVGSITSVVEKYSDSFIGGYSSTTLAATDYEIVPGGRQIRRLGSGVNPSSCWGQRVTVTYVPADETARRIKALIDLCKLTLSSTPGLKSESVGGNEYSYTAGDVESEREKIFARLGSNQRRIA